MSTGSGAVDDSSRTLEERLYAYECVCVDSGKFSRLLAVATDTVSLMRVGDAKADQRPGVSVLAAAVDDAYRESLFDGRTATYRRLFEHCTTTPLCDSENYRRRQTSGGRGANVSDYCELMGLSHGDESLGQLHFYLRGIPLGVQSFCITCSVFLLVLIFRLRIHKVCVCHTPTIPRVVARLMWPNMQYRTFICVLILICHNGQSYNSCTIVSSDLVTICHIVGNRGGWGRANLTFNNNIFLMSSCLLFVDVWVV